MTNATLGEKVAVLTSRLNSHEQQCLERMEDIKEMFVTVKSDAKKIHDLVLTIMLSLAGAGALTLLSVILHSLELL